MANRRLISRAVVEDDDFIDLSKNARLLYFYISLNCDDEGFCGNPKSIGRLAGFNSKEIPELLKELTDSGFLISFDNSKVVAVTDWYRNNTINSNRWSATEYVAQRNQLTVNDNRRYQLSAVGQGLDQPFFQVGHSEHPKKNNSVGHDTKKVISYLVGLTPKPYGDLDNALQDQAIVSSIHSLLKDHSVAELETAAEWTKRNRSPRSLSQLVNNLPDYWA